MSSSPDGRDAVRFLTFSCYQRLPLLSRDHSRRWLIESLDESRRKLGFEIWAYVVMPEHVHLLVWLGRSPCATEALLAAVKRPVSAKARQFLEGNGARDWLDRLTVQRGSRAEFRFWQKGGGYDECLETDRAVGQVVDYVHGNPVRRGLVERPTDWPWSSARFHVLGDHGPLRVDRPRL